MHQYQVGDHGLTVGGHRYKVTHIHVDNIVAEHTVAEGKTVHLFHTLAGEPFGYGAAYKLRQPNGDVLARALAAASGGNNNGNVMPIPVRVRGPEAANTAPAIVPVALLRHEQAPAAVAATR